MSEEKNGHDIKRRIIISLLLICVGFVFLIATAPTVSPEQRKIFISHGLLDKGLKGFDIAVKSLQQERLDIQNGKISELESNKRAKTVYVPMFKQVYDDLSQVSLPLDDERILALKGVTRFSLLMIELLSMNPESINTERVATISSELSEIARGIGKWKEDTKRENKR